MVGLPDFIFNQRSLLVAWSKVHFSLISQALWSTTWTTYRTIGGNVQMRISDISLANGVQWQKANLVVSLLDSSGKEWGKTATINKTWGAITPYISLGKVDPKRLLKLRTVLNIYADTGWGGNWLPSGYWGTWDGDLRWDNEVSGGSID